ncbi:MAG: copper uptake system-associated protein [Rhizobiaceae bacterium]|nr:copper uptake system-associated protein [Rhizobiaceae bacterium]
MDIRVCCRGSAELGGARLGDAGAIKHLMMATFDKPDSRLSVEPVMVSRDLAVAGWSQGEMGGRHDFHARRFCADTARSTRRVRGRVAKIRPVRSRAARGSSRHPAP